MMLLSFIIVLCDCESLCDGFPKVSVIVPVHDEGLRVSECLVSILNQTLWELEVLCVVDISAVKSLEILNGFAKNDKRVHIIQKENCGPACTCNRGLSKATGEYVTFVHPHDWVESYNYKVVYEGAKENDVDVVCWGLFSGAKKMIKCTKNVVVKGKETATFLLPGVLHSASVRLYRRSMLVENGVLFDESIKAGEDVIFNLDVLPFVNSVLCINQSFYHYNPQSTTLHHILYSKVENRKALADGIYKRLDRLISNSTCRNCLSEGEVKKVKAFARRVVRRK